MAMKQPRVVALARGCIAADGEAACGALPPTGALQRLAGLIDIERALNLVLAPRLDGDHIPPDLVDYFSTRPCERPYHELRSRGVQAVTDVKPLLHTHQLPPRTGADGVVQAVPA